VEKNMKAQDVVILLKVLLSEGKNWRMSDLALSLNLSQSEISKSLKRMESAKLYDSSIRKIARNAFYELIIYGVPYFFPAEVGRISKGIATSIGHEFFKSKIVSESQYIWPHINGKVRGETVMSLYKGAIEAALVDKELYLLLALIDVLRIGRVREINLARTELKQRIVG
jgi:hypothetical protein